MIATPKQSAGLKRIRPWSALFVVGSAVAAVVPGCGGPLPSEESNVRLVVVNEGSRPAVLDLVEYDFVTNDAGDSLGWDMVPLEPGATLSGDLTFPSTGSWAFTINGLVAIASFEFAERDQTVPGTGPLPYHITVFDDALQASMPGDRGADPAAGTTTAPDATPP